MEERSFRHLTMTHQAELRWAASMTESFNHRVLRRIHHGHLNRSRRRKWRRKAVGKLNFLLSCQMMIMKICVYQRNASSNVSGHWKHANSKLQQHESLASSLVSLLLGFRWLSWSHSTYNLVWLVISSNIDDVEKRRSSITTSDNNNNGEQHDSQSRIK